MQFCHGAPGFVVCLGEWPDDTLDDLLLAVVSLVWWNASNPEAHVVRTNVDLALETGKLDANMAYDKSRDTPGPATIAVALERSVEDKNQRVIVIGNGGFLSNTYLGNGGNLVARRAVNSRFPNPGFLSLFRSTGPSASANI